LQLEYIYLLTWIFIRERGSCTITRSIVSKIKESYILWRDSVAPALCLDSSIHRIDQRYPHLDRRLSDALCFAASSLLIYPAQLENLESVHSTVLVLFSLLRSVPNLLILSCDIFASIGPRNVYKDMLNNLFSPIYHVVINHQNQTQTNGIRGNVRYIVSPNLL
jgi:hypothetical protein